MQRQDTEISAQMQAEQNQEQFILDNITSSPIKKILSYNNSLNRLKTIITTQNGLCIINNHTKKYRKFQDQNNPFYPEKTQGISIGNILQERTQVAIVPHKSTKTFCNTTVYIFDYTLKTILYSNDFFLPIRSLTLTTQQIIVSNNKRIIIYNYLQDEKNKDHKYYLDLYQLQTPNNHIRYLQMFCQEKFANNSAPQNQENSRLDEEPMQVLGAQKNSINFCKCGQYSISATKPYRLVYCRVSTINGTKRLSLVIYDWAIDKQYVFETMEYSQQFNFAISSDGNYIGYTESEGRNIKVHKIGQQGVHQLFRISRSIKQYCSFGFFTAKDNLWLCIIRQGKNNGHMHIMKISQKAVQQPCSSDYKRYFWLYRKTFIDYGISDNLIGPDFYINNEVLYSYSLCGIVHDVIDFKRTGNHPSKNAQNFLKWTEDENY